MISISNSWFWLSNIYLRIFAYDKNDHGRVSTVNFNISCLWPGLFLLYGHLRVATDHLQKFITTEHEICISRARENYHGAEWLKRHFYVPTIFDPTRRQTQDQTQTSNRNNKAHVSRVICIRLTTGRIITRTDSPSLGRKTSIRIKHYWDYTN